MVGFVSEPSFEEGSNQASKPKNLKEPLEPFDPKLSNLSFADSFLDFDAIKEYFEDSPEPERVSLDRIDFGDFEKCVGMDDKGSCDKNDFKDPIADGSNPMFEELKAIVNGTGSGCEVKVKEERVEFEREGNLGCSIEKEMGRVSLVGESSFVVPDGSIVRSEVESDEAKIGNFSLVNGLSSVISNGSGVNKKVISDEDDSESDSESESESESSSSLSSSSSSSDDDDDEDEESNKEENEVKEEARVEVNREVNKLSDIEEGEIRDVDEEETMDDDVGEVEEEEEVGDKMVDWSDAEFDDVEEDAVEMRGPIRSKNELEALPPVPPVDVTLQPHHQMMPVGVILSIIGPQVIVEGVEKHNPLNEGSILWVTEKRSPLGLVDEIFGPVKNPYYVVRYNSESEVPTRIHNGTLISFVPEFANHVLNDKNLYKKGYDASGKDDEEVIDEAEFSDDEKEAEFKRMLTMSKRGMNDQTVRNRRNDRKKVKNRERNWKNNTPLDLQIPLGVGQPSPNRNQHNISSVGAAMGHDNCSSSFTIGQEFSGGTSFIPPFAPMAQSQTIGVFLPSNGVWANGLPAQQPQSAVIPGGFPANNMPWPAQNQLQHPYQMPMPNGMPIQQQFNPSQGSLPHAALPIGTPNLFAGPTFSPWPVMEQNYSNQTTFGMGFQVQRSPSTMNSMNMGDQGMMSSGIHVERNCNLQPPGVIPGNIQAPQQFNMGATSRSGRKPHHRGGGRFAGARGRQPSK